jgi:outer membrane protein TolC
MPKQEAAQLADREDELKLDLAKARAELRRLLSADADEPLAGTPPALPIDPDSYRAHLHHHPELEAFGRAGEKAEAEVREAIAGKRPDWGVSAAYQRRPPPYSDMVSVQFTFDLPLFTRTRQDPRIAAKQKQVEEIAAEREAMLRSHTAELDSALAEYVSVSSRLERAGAVWIPLAQEKVDLQMASYRAGKTDLGNVLGARRELVEQRLKAIDLEQKRQETISRLYFNYGEGIQ